MEVRILFLVTLTYVKPLTEVEAALESHNRFLEDHYASKHFVFSGRRVPRVGGLILMNVDSEATVKEIIQEDPFYQLGIATYEVIEFQPTKYDPQFAPFVE